MDAARHMIVASSTCHFAQCAVREGTLVQCVMMKMAPSPSIGEVETTLRDPAQSHDNWEYGCLHVFDVPGKVGDAHK